MADPSPHSDTSEPNSPPLDVLTLWEVPVMDSGTLLPPDQPGHEMSLPPTSEIMDPPIPPVPQNRPPQHFGQSVFGRRLYQGSASSSVQPPPPPPPPPPPRQLPRPQPPVESEEVFFHPFFWDLDAQFVDGQEESAQYDLPPLPQSLGDQFNNSMQNQGNANVGNESVMSYNDQNEKPSYTGLEQMYSELMNIGGNEMRQNEVLNAGERDEGNFSAAGVLSTEENNSVGLNSNAGGSQTNNPPNTPSCGHGCQVLRQVIHTDGVTTRRLELHAGIGSLFHAICEILYDLVGAPTTSIPLFNFNIDSFDMVRYFLEDYFKLQERDETQRLVHDSVSDVYRYMCAMADAAGGGLGVTPDTPNMLHPAETSTPKMPATAAHQPGNSGAFQFPRSKISIQRERTNNMKLEDIEDFMHLPIQKASKQVSVCTTVLKKICRRSGVSRWPHRRVKAIDRSIMNLKKSLLAKKRTKTVEEIIAEIEKLTKERAECYQPDQPADDQRDEPGDELDEQDEQDEDIGSNSSSSNNSDNERG